MQIRSEEIRSKVKTFILEELVRDHSTEISDDTELISNGYVDSVTTLQLVDFIEKEFNIEFEAHEVESDFLGTLALIVNTIKSKLK